MRRPEILRTRHTFFVKIKIANRELDTLVDFASTKSILGKEGIELAAKFSQEIKPSGIEAILFPNYSIESVIEQVMQLTYCLFGEDRRRQVFRD